MLFTEGKEIFSKFPDKPIAIKKAGDETDRCPRCGSGREKIDKGVCKGEYLAPDGKKSLCFLRW